MIVRNTTGAHVAELNKVMTGEDILYFQELVRRVPVPDNVLEYAVGLVQKTRPGTNNPGVTAQYIAYGAGPRASQYLNPRRKMSRTDQWQILTGY